MISIALIGNDGSGKSTIANLLLEDPTLKLKYIYMGTSLKSSNYLLPWSRFALWFKEQSIRRKAKKQGIKDEKYLSTHHVEHRRKKTGHLRTFLRVSNRFIESSYRLLISYVFRMRGHNVLFDRHFLFEVAPYLHDGEPMKMHPLEEAFFRFWRDVVPNPGVIIFLDAPSDILIARKGEGTPEYLNERRDAWLYQGERLNNFHIVDVDRSIDEVYRDISNILKHALT